ncbi:MAG: hypothetical protein FJ026_14275, partial [Chloroflexi bacterium]|nr:hypothetical protein [Chloroflexota bacterium]
MPSLLARIPLAPAGAELRDLLLDPASNRLYVTDTAGRLHVVDAGTYEVLTTIPALGDITVDPAHHRLYISPRNSLWQDKGDLTVVDTTSLSAVGTVSPGGAVAVDPTRDHFFVGNWLGTELIGYPNVAVYDGSTLQRLGELPMPGRPVYNPLRDELYLLRHSVHIVDPETWQITGEVVPDIVALGAYYGSPWAGDASVFPERNLLMVTLFVPVAGGHGAGIDPEPRFFDATTLEPITDQAQMPPVEELCNGRLPLAEPVQGRVYRGRHFFSYQSFNWLMIYDLEGQLVDVRDGLGLGITNPNTGQMYSGDTVYDLTTLSPLGLLTVDIDCICALDLKAGRIYAQSGGELLILSERGGQPRPLPLTESGSVLTGTVKLIQVSPGYAQDHTLFVNASNAHGCSRVYRSADGGHSWAHLRGGLPDGWSGALILSPDFARDRTLFVGSRYATYRGEGVYRSTDGGDTWQPMWNGLQYLRVQKVVISPFYAKDGTVLAYADYDMPPASGASVFRSTDRGLSWSLVMTATYSDGLPALGELLPADPGAPAVHFQLTSTLLRAGFRSMWHVERSADSQTWRPVLIFDQPSGVFDFGTILTSPSFNHDSTVYVVTAHDLFRSTDGGSTWERWADERLATLSESDRITAGAISPLLDDGGHHLFIATENGEFWPLNPATLAWQPMPATVPVSYPAPLPGPTPPPHCYQPVGAFAELWA